MWQKAFGLIKEGYTLTGEFPAHEKYGLVAQIRRAAVSVPSNIAEGQARHSTCEFILLVSHAEGSAAELETQLLISVELGYTRRWESAESARWHYESTENARLASQEARLAQLTTTH